MAQPATHPTNETRNPLARTAEVVWNALVSMGESNSLVRQMQALQDLSDAELAERGIKREDIARHVFAASAYI
jgi:uncharacterized protein YjiS (DUF1127 family)